jgi:GTP:adenosylcobinamide-phosphate guanylyltransferase
MSNRVIVAIQARMNSSRLPGKVMADIGGKPMIRRVWEACDGPWERKILTTLKRSDDVLCNYLDSQNMSYRRGSEEDVLSRYAEVAIMQKPTCLVRICGDAPFMRAEWIKAAVEADEAVFVPNALHAAAWHVWGMCHRYAAPTDWEHAGSAWFEQNAMRMELVPDGYRMVNTQEDLDYAREQFGKA